MATISAATVVGLSTLGFVGLAGAAPSGTSPAPTPAPPAGGAGSGDGDAETTAFLGADHGEPIARPAGLPPSASDAAVARAFLNRREARFGLDVAGAALDLVESSSAVKGITTVRFSETVNRVPVLGGDLIVNLDQNQDILSATAETLPEEAPSPTPEISAAAAAEMAIASVAKTGEYGSSELEASSPQLHYYDSRILGGPGLERPTLVWRTEVTAGALEPLDQLVLVDAELGVVALSFNQTENALSRTICDAGLAQAKVPCTAPFARTEGGPATGDPDVDDAYDLSGVTYDFFKNGFGRDSVDDAGLPLISTVKFCEGACPFENAFWNGEQMVYGPDYASADDVVGHELAHGVTDFTSSLFYYYQSGAINESLSDVFGEFVDLTSTASGPDSSFDRWLMGEDLPIGAIRDMEDPPSFNDPDRTGSPIYHADESDSGGVHINSGVNNKAATLMVDGGSFNGQTITPIGLDKAGEVYYVAETTLLRSASDYQDLFKALNQACTMRIGTKGITAADCAQVNKAALATEMDKTPTNAPATDAPVCNTGQVPSNLFFDNLENPASGRWATSAEVGLNEWYYPQNPNPFGFDATYATSGTTNFWGNDNGESDFGNPGTPNVSSIAMTSGVALPAGTTYMRFNHAHGFEADFLDNYDGGVLEYSTDGGVTWTDAGSLITHNGYSGTLAAGNPIGARPAFVAESNGYIGSRLDLTPLAGQSVRFRFKIANDDYIGDYGWFVDDIQIYRCVADPDTDGDGFPSSTDNCPSIANPDQLDKDGDGKGNACDTDDDGDGVADAADACQLGASTGPDTDGDGCKNTGEDADDDGDGVADTSDSCPTGAATGVDADGDGCIDAEDTDDDGDGVADAADACDLLSGSDSNGCPKIARDVTLKYSEKREKFKGKLTPGGACASDQKVGIFRKKKGKDPKVTSATTKDSGKFKKKKKVGDGKYYAKVKATTIPTTGNCSKAKSKPFEVN